MHSEIASCHHLTQQKAPTTLILTRNQQLLIESQHLTEHPHELAGKGQQSKTTELLLIAVDAATFGLGAKEIIVVDDLFEANTLVEEVVGDMTKQEHDIELPCRRCKSLRLQIGELCIGMFKEILLQTTVVERIVEPRRPVVHLDGYVASLQKVDMMIARLGIGYELAAVGDHRSDVSILTVSEK